MVTANQGLQIANSILDLFLLWFSGYCLFILKLVESCIYCFGY